MVLGGDDSQRLPIKPVDNSAVLRAVEETTHEDSFGRSIGR